jgi:hypothetical protein
MNRSEGEQKETEETKKQGEEEKGGRRKLSAFLRSLCFLLFKNDQSRYRSPSSLCVCKLNRHCGWLRQ